MEHENQDSRLRARQAFADRNPESRRYFESARQVLPGGHTRTVLTHPPFPLVFASGEGATLTDLDGHTYLDFLGDYTAGLLGHSERRVLDAVQAALATNASVGGIHPAEERLARLMCERFGLDKVRFTNSGTEANLMAITTALAAGGRSKVMVFEGGYHGGVLYFAHGTAPWNVPYEFVIAPYNDLGSAQALIEEHGSDLAAVVIEPMQGAGGCLPATRSFLLGVFEAARRVGALVVADEVMTSRHGPSGLVALHGGKADLSTYGKYIGGGFSFGAFGGRSDLMDYYDTSTGDDGGITHAGTFNNNLATMTAGTVVLGEVYTVQVAIDHTARGEEFRGHLTDVVARSVLPIGVTGFGSMMALHADASLSELVFLGLLERGVYTAPRGMVNLSVAHTDDDLAAFLDRLDDCLQSLR